MTETYHLALREEWAEQANTGSYAPESFEREGFIHCTNGEDNVIAVGNRYFRADAGPFACLVIEVNRVEAPVKFEDPNHIFPHIYGRLNTDAVVRVRDVHRDKDGKFVGLGT